jgi:hypothetical protein
MYLNFAFPLLSVMPLAFGSPVGDLDGISEIKNRRDVVKMDWVVPNCCGPVKLGKAPTLMSGHTLLRLKHTMISSKIINFRA